MMAGVADSKRPSSAIRLNQLPKRQSGVALMIVILVFALVSILSVGMYNRQSLFVQTASNMLAQKQAYEYAVASEIYGRRLLKADWDEDSEEKEFVDDLEQTQNSIVIPVEEALLEAQFNDVQGKLNLNDMVNLDGSPNTLMQKRLDRLLNRLAIDSIKVEMIQDWIDEDQDPYQFEGSEDGDYLAQETPYRTAGQPFQHLSELLLLQGVTQKDYETLLPFVSVLPQGQAPINVNTAPPEVLQTLFEGMNDQQAEELGSKRENEPWKDINALKSDPLVGGLAFDDHYLSVNSEFFEIATRITLSERVVRLVSLIYRKQADGEMQVLSRDQGQKYLITKEKIAVP